MGKSIEIRDLKKNVDERGSFTEIMRYDWKEFFGDKLPVQSNLSISYPGVVRAWHKHEKGQFDFFVVVKGCMKIVTWNENTKEIEEVVVSGENLKVVKVDGSKYHGTKTIGAEPSYTIYFTSNMYQYDNPDEIRKKWDDKEIGYDWYKSPNK
jgi:dTDP-4-dehydrorhamnose 3,5-epimerase